MSKTSNQPMWPIRKIFPFSCALAGRERHAVPVAEMAQELVAVDPVRAAHRGDDGGAVVVGREELEAHRLDPRAGGAAEADVACERGFEPVGEDQAERDVEAADQRDGRRERGVERVLRLLVRAPVEVEAARRLDAREHVLGDGDRREPRRRHQRLLRAGDDDVDSPGVGLERDGAERRDGVDDEKRLADLLLDRTHVGDDAGRGVGLLAEDELDAGFAHRGAHLGGVGSLAPLVADRLHIEAVVLADRDPALAEGAVADDGDAVARRAEVRDRRLHRARAGGGEEQHVRAGAVDVAQPAERPFVDRAEVGAAVVDDRLGACRQHLGRHRRRPGREQVALLHAVSLATPEEADTGTRPFETCPGDSPPDVSRRGLPVGAMSRGLSPGPVCSRHGEGPSPVMSGCERA